MEDRKALCGFVEGIGARVTLVEGQVPDREAGVECEVPIKTVEVQDQDINSDPTWLVEQHGFA